MADVQLEFEQVVGVEVAMAMAWQDALEELEVDSNLGVQHKQPATPMAGGYDVEQVEEQMY